MSGALLSLSRYSLNVLPVLSFVLIVFPDFLACDYDLRKSFEDREELIVKHFDLDLVASDGV
jgi:hypothetical protein